jgi:hypothetical protein
VKRIFCHVSAVAHLGTPNLDRPNPGLDGALRSMTVTHDAVAAIRQLQRLLEHNLEVGRSNATCEMLPIDADIVFRYDAQSKKTDIEFKSLDG